MGLHRRRIFRIMPPTASAVLRAAKRLLPVDLRRAIVVQSAKAFAKRTTPSLADAVVAKYRLASQNAIQSLCYVLAVQRCTPTPKFLALGLYLSDGPVPFFRVRPLDRTMKQQHEDWLVHSKQPARYVAAMFRVRPVHGPWARRDRSTKVALEPMLASTAVLGGQTMHDARHALYSLSRLLACKALPNRLIFPIPEAGVMM